MKHHFDVKEVFNMAKRINVTISDTLNTKLDIYSERYGVTKSSIVGFVLGQWMDNFERSNDNLQSSINNKGFLNKVFNNIDFVKDDDALEDD